MKDFSEKEYSQAKKWIADKINEGTSWDDVALLRVSSDLESEVLDELKDYGIIPKDMSLDEWALFVEYRKNQYIPIEELYGIANEDGNSLSVPTGRQSSWVNYKEHLIGRQAGQGKISDVAVEMIERNCHWILNHLKRDTSSTGPVKGLVMGSVQSGKTANMIGLVTMAADYDWNIFIVLSGTIENLRQQTLKRFKDDLSASGGVSWYVLNYTDDPDVMVDMIKGKDVTADKLSMNVFRDGKSENKWKNRYVFVCLKNAKRLQNLINWLQKNQDRKTKMRILVMDDEADQASINTINMLKSSDEEDKERTKINRLIIDLVKDCDDSGQANVKKFQAMNYVCYTATPYANVLNEAYRDSLYPKNFICSLPETKEYFGPKVIWGSEKDGNYPGLDNILRTISDAETEELDHIYRGQSEVVPRGLQEAVAWFLCAAAVLRNRGYKKPVTMLIHTTARQNGHFWEYEILRKWLEKDGSTGKIMSLCERVYAVERDEFRLKDLREGYPDYADLDEVWDDFPDFDDIRNEIESMLSEIENIRMEVKKGETAEPVYTENGIHLCVDNCVANRYTDEGINLRVIYPDGEQLASMKKAPVFIVAGGNTLSRGLTLEGLVCTYFGRNVNQVDTLMQMARWFGYRQGYELLQRIWMPLQVQKKFELMEQIDEKLKREIEDFMVKGKSPASFGPRIMSSSEIAKFTLTAKNKAQNMIPYDMDFTGDSYEVTKFENSNDILCRNIIVTEEFLTSLGDAVRSEAIESAFVWRNVKSEDVISGFINKYTIFECSSLYTDIGYFKAWLERMNGENKFMNWNVAVAGDNTAMERWKVAGADVGKIERSRKINSPVVDIGSLRSGRDILSDVDVSHLSDEKKAEFLKRKKDGKGLLRVRYDMGLEDYPLLLLYRIDKEKGRETKNRTRIGTYHDIIGFGIIISGQKEDSDYVRTVQIRMPE